MVGKKIRTCREYMGLSQVQLAELSGINVGTIRKYELGIRNPKPQQLEKIAKAMHLNYSVFLDFNIETVGDVFSLLFAIDKAVDLSLSTIPSDDGDSDMVTFTFKNEYLQDTLKKWCEFKTIYDRDRDPEKEKRLILKNEELPEVEELKKQIAELDDLYECWKLHTMGIFFNSNIIVTKETKEVKEKIDSSSNFVNPH